jgi:outer membrane receptor protein involved in Fe transport
MQPVRDPVPTHVANRSVASLARIGLLALVLAGAYAAPVRAQLQVGAVQGSVTDAQAAPLPGATVQLMDGSGMVVDSAVTDASGHFAIRDVAPGSYIVRVDIAGAAAVLRRIVVRGSLPVELTLQTGPFVAEEVVVRGDAASRTPEHPWTVAGETVRRVGEPLPSQRVQSALATLPGWMGEDNGLLHVRGVDDGLLYVQDGIPVYERVDRLFGLPPNPSGIASLHVLNGYIPAEYGFKAGAVVVVRSEAGVRGAWSGTLDAGLADEHTGHLEGFGAGPIASRGGLMISASDERSDRFLDPVDVHNRHNQGRSTSGSAQVTWGGGPSLLTGSIQGGANRYEVPNSAEQDEAGQDARQRTDQLLLSGSWQRVLSERTVWQTSAYRRYGSASLIPSLADTPVTAEARRSDTRYGVLASVTHQRDRHTLKAGGEASALRLDETFAFAVTDPDEAEEAGLSEQALSYTPDAPFTFADRRRPSVWALYAQDVYQPIDRLTVNAGLRYDHSRLLVDASQWSPRLGAAYGVREGTIVRASYMRLFQPPQAEYLLLASSEEARILSPFVEDAEISGGADVPPERQTALEVSATQLVAGWELTGSIWRRRATDVDDPNVFFGTTVTVPNSVARQHAHGFDLHLASPLRGTWAAAVSYSWARVTQFGPVTGGLFLEDEVAVIQDGTEFVPDHDQRHSLAASGSYGARGGLWRIGATFRYQRGPPVAIETGLVDAPFRASEPLADDVVDLESGRVKARAVLDLRAEWRVLQRQPGDLSLVAWVNNVTNQTYAFNFGNPFSGTHYGPPRRIGLSVRAAFGRSR